MQIVLHTNTSQDNIISSGSVFLSVKKSSVTKINLGCCLLLHLNEDGDDENGIIFIA